MALDWGWAVGLAIPVAILLVLRDAARAVYRRLMDAVDPHLVEAAETTLRAHTDPHTAEAVDHHAALAGHR